VTSRRGGRWRPVVVAAGAATAVALLGGTVTELGPWYQDLQKPSWQPPGWVFGPVWTVIFGLTAMSGLTAWRHAPSGREREWVIGLYALNGFLNVLWSLIFFRLQRPDWALVEVVLLWLSILLPMIVVAAYARTASLLLVPYLAWVTIAGVLNYEVVRLNGPF
jgi:tryptophan-rich sensory protein